MRGLATASRRYKQVPDRSVNAMQPTYRSGGTANFLQVCPSVDAATRLLYGASNEAHSAVCQSLRCASTLSYEEVLVGDTSKSNVPQPSLALVVHGLLGTGRNWRTFARSLGKQAANETGR